MECNDAFQSLDKGSPMTPNTPASSHRYQSCIDACNACTTACKRCAQACLEMSP